LYGGEVTMSAIELSGSSGIISDEWGKTRSRLDGGIRFSGAETVAERKPEQSFLE
jgi:hypothetical protein